MSERSTESAVLNLEGWSAWDRVPENGPGVFIVDAALWEIGTVHGRWFNPFDPAIEVRNELRAMLNREPFDGEFAIVDQVGLGGLQITETPSLRDLHDEAIETLGGRSAVDFTTLEPLPVQATHETMEPTC